MLHNSANSFETLDLKTSIYKKKIVEVTFNSKFQNGGVIQDGATNHCFILLGLAQLFLNRFQHINPFWTSKIMHSHILLAQNNSIQNEVNILDGDFTLIYPFV
jgi:hypothetical protein